MFAIPPEQDMGLHVDFFGKFRPSHVATFPLGDPGLPAARPSKWVPHAERPEWADVQPIPQVCHLSNLSVYHAFPPYLKLPIKRPVVSLGFGSPSYPIVHPYLFHMQNDGPFNVVRINYTEEFRDTMAQAAVWVWSLWVWSPGNRGACHSSVSFGTSRIHSGESDSRCTWSTL